MSGWTGFSDDDLKKLKRSSPNANTEGVKIFPKEVQLGKNKPKVRRFMTTPNRIKSQTGENDASSPRVPKLSTLKPEDVARAEQVVPPSVAPQRAKVVSADRRNSLTKLVPKMPSLPESGEPSDAEDEQKINEDKTAECDAEKDSSQAISEDLSKVERFQQQQKMMEELNRQKKRLLFQAINERQKQAAEETVKLRQIQQELSHLDNMLTADVSVMRDRIETVSIQFMEAQKKYNRIEKEFIAVKMELYRAAELKEQLTEHLYMMIHQNEMRKAEKLSFLMQQLELDDDGSGAMEMGISDLPPLSAFSTYSVQTFPSPKGPGSPIQLINVPCFPASPPDHVAATTKDGECNGEVAVAASGGSNAGGTHTEAAIATGEATAGDIRTGESTDSSEAGESGGAEKDSQFTTKADVKLGDNEGSHDAGDTASNDISRNDDKGEH